MAKTVEWWILSGLLYLFIFEFLEIITLTVAVWLLKNSILFSVDGTYLDIIFK